MGTVSVDAVPRVLQPRNDDRKNRSCVVLLSASYVIDHCSDFSSSSVRIYIPAVCHGPSLAHEPAGELCCVVSDTHAINVVSDAGLGGKMTRVPNSE